MLVFGLYHQLKPALFVAERKIDRQLKVRQKERREETSCSIFMKFTRDKFQGRNKTCLRL